MTVGEKLEELLTWRGMSQYELARRSGISKGSISAYVTGKNGVSFDVAQKLAAGLGVSVWTLFNGEPLQVTPLDLTASESQMIVDFRNATLDQQELIRSVFDVVHRQNTRR